MTIDTFEADRFSEQPFRRARPQREELSSGLLRRLVRDSVRRTNERLEREAAAANLSVVDYLSGKEPSHDDLSVL